MTRLRICYSNLHIPLAKTFGGFIRRGMVEGGEREVSSLKYNLFSGYLSFIRRKKKEELSLNYRHADKLAQPQKFILHVD